MSYLLDRLGQIQERLGTDAYESDEQRSEDASYLLGVAIDQTARVTAMVLWLKAHHPGIATEMWIELGESERIKSNGGQV